MKESGEVKVEEEGDEPWTGATSHPDYNCAHVREWI